MKTKLVIFGITGDLSRRKLLPALDEIVTSGEGVELSIVGVSRREVNVAELLVAQPKLIDRMTIFSMDLANPSDYDRLRESLGVSDDEQILMYLSVPPGAAADIVDYLGQAGLNAPNVKILFEKPFGFDLVSAGEVIERTARYFAEDQLYRIDHYMAKDVAQNIIALRQNAENHHHSWDKESIQSIEVVASEKIGVEGRGDFYEQTGALRDFVQGHLLQLLSLVIMDIPTEFSLNELPKYRYEALRNLGVADPAESIRAQYLGYQDEVGNPGSLTETFVSLQLESVAPRWSGVPLMLITGKHLNEKRSYVQVHYKDGTKDIFEEGTGVPEQKLPDAYERVLLEAIKGSKSLFTTSPEVLRAWEIIAPIQAQWKMDSAVPTSYSPGSTIAEVIAKTPHVG